MLTPLAIYAANITKPNNFTAGSTAVAAEVNANFDTLYNKINDNTKYLGTYCGATAAGSTGNIGGYVAAKNLCVTACSNANAHICSGHEITVTLQQGITMPASGLWFSSYVATGTGTNVMDCNGWATARPPIRRFFSMASQIPAQTLPHVTQAIELPAVNSSSCKSTLGKFWESHACSFLFHETARPYPRASDDACAPDFGFCRTFIKV